MAIDDKARKRALDKIRKCLALGNSSNENEAEAALRQARKLKGDEYLAALAGQEDGGKAILHVPMGTDAPVERIEL